MQKQELTFEEIKNDQFLLKSISLLNDYCIKNQKDGLMLKIKLLPEDDSVAVELELYNE